MKTFRFRCIAFDETLSWKHLPVECHQVFGVYAYIDCEATFCGSDAAMSWTEFLYNVFVGLPDGHPFVEEHNGLGVSGYCPFIESVRQAPAVSRLFNFTAHSREEAWEQARNYFIGNPPSIPALLKH